MQKSQIPLQQTLPTPRFGMPENLALIPELIKEVRALKENQQRFADATTNVYGQNLVLELKPDETVSFDVVKHVLKLQAKQLEILIMQGLITPYTEGKRKFKVSEIITYLKEKK